MCLILFGFLTGGPYYDLIGRTGNNVGRKLRGKNVFSMRPSKSHKPPTQAQLNQRLKWSLVTEFFSWITPALNVGFVNYNTEMSGFNAAVSYNLLNAVTGVTPDYTLDYSKVLLSRGDLSNLTGMEAAATVISKIDYSWVSVVTKPLSNAEDRVTFVVYNAMLNRFATAVQVAARSAEEFSQTVPLEWSGDQVHIWVFTSSFTSEERGGNVSNSYYMGSVTLL